MDGFQTVKMGLEVKCRKRVSFSPWWNDSAEHVGGEMGAIRGVLKRKNTTNKSSLSLKHVLADVRTTVAYVMRCFSFPWWGVPLHVLGLSHRHRLDFSKACNLLVFVWVSLFLESLAFGRPICSFQGTVFTWLHSILFKHFKQLPN